MSDISAKLKKTIKEIKRLADGSVDDQLKACDDYLQKLLHYGTPKHGIPVSVIRELLPTIIKFMESNDHELQEIGAAFIIDITSTPDEANTKLVIDAGVIPKLKNLLSSPNTDVIISAMKALINIAYDFPEKFVENEMLPTIIQCLKSDDKLVSQYSAWMMKNISYESDERIAAIFEVNGVELLITLLKSKDNRACEEYLKALLNIVSFNYQYCQSVLDLNVLKSVKQLCDRLFADKKAQRSIVKVDKSKLKQEEAVKLSAIVLIRNVTSYGVAQIDFVINDKFISTILQQIKSGMTPEIKIEALKIIENIIDAKPDFIPALVQDYNIFSFYYSNLGSSNANLVITTLTAMNSIIELFQGRDISRQKIRECGGPTKLSSLRGHSNEEICHLSTMIYEFVFDVKPIVGNPPTPQNFDRRTTSESRQPLDLPVAASTNNETAQNEMKHFPTAGNRTRPTSDGSSLEASSTRNDGNIRDNHAGRQIVVDSETAATAAENIRSGSVIAPALPVSSASTNNGTMPNDIPSRKPSPDTFVLPNEVTPPAAAAANNDIIRDEVIKYWRPAEFLIDQYCGTLGVQCNRKQYSEFMSKIEFTQITSNSKPDAVFETIDQTGFGCLSILLTGNEEASSTIRMKINKKFINDLDETGNFDEEKITTVIAPPYLMKEEHLQTIATWLKCRILVYCNGWKKYGNWDEENSMIPIFVLEKKEIEGKIEYCIVLTLKNE